MPLDAPPFPDAAVLEAPDFPAETRAVSLAAADFAKGGLQTARFLLSNAHHAVLHVRLSSLAAWLTVTPSEIALGPGEKQTVALRTDTDAARASVRAGGAPSAPVRLLYQRLFPGGRGEAPAPPAQGEIQFHLPLATCPACHRSLDSAIATGETHPVPDVCPYCFERLRPCPVCHAPNSWLARHCLMDPSHIIRPFPDWETLGGSAAHTGEREGRATPGISLARRWSYPSVPPARREAALSWSAPVAAYGMVAAAAATTDGEAHIFAFDALTGAPLWEPYPLDSPVYPDRGGAAVADGKLFAATVGGVCLALDALRGTRLWETRLPGMVYGAVVPLDSLLLVPVIRDGRPSQTGLLVGVRADNGEIQFETPLEGPPDTAPAAAGGRAFVHDDRGNLYGVDTQSGAVEWQTPCGAGFDAAPIVREGRVFSATSAGEALCHDTITGALVWRHVVTNAPFAGTPACDGSLLYLPADDGIHLLSASAGRPVRRFPLRQPVRSAPLVRGGALFFGGTDGAVYGALPGRAPERLYETSVTGAASASQIVAAPALADNAFFVAATNGVLYALSLVEEGVSPVAR